MAKNMAVYGLQNQRARMVGEMKYLEEANSQHLARIAKLSVAVDTNQVKADALRVQVAALDEAARTAFSVELQSTSRRTVPKHHFDSWGAITRAVLHQLSLTKDVPLSTVELATYVNVQLQLGLTEEALRSLQVSVRHTLKRLRNKGLVERATAQSAPGRSSTWLLAPVV